MVPRIELGSTLYKISILGPVILKPPNLKSFVRLFLIDPLPGVLGGGTMLCQGLNQDSKYKAVTRPLEPFDQRLNFSFSVSFPFFPLLKTKQRQKQNKTKKPQDLHVSPRKVEPQSDR